MKELEKYLRSRNPQEREYCLYWLSAFGIQSVVSLRPSEDLIPIISRHIEGIVDIHRTRKELREYYNNVHRREADSHIHREEEADKVSVRIMEVLLSDEFDLTFEYFSKVHHHMFHGIYNHSGELRDKPLSKKEWVLGNTNVLYPSTDQLREKLDYLFAKERCTNYSSLSERHKIRHYSEFISRLFMANAFQFANSRAVFVFALKYLLTLGYQIKNDTFYKEAWYFRNAIIRACYTNMHQGIYPTTEYMEMFNVVIQLVLAKEIPVFFIIIAIYYLLSMAWRPFKKNQALGLVAFLSV